MRPPPPDLAHALRQARLSLVLAALCTACVAPSGSGDNEGKHDDRSASGATVWPALASQGVRRTLRLQLGSSPGAPPSTSVENQNPGSDRWRLSSPTGQLEGYADRTSYLPGDTVTIHAASAQDSSGSWELWRLGYYGGLRGRLLLRGEEVSFPERTDPVLDPATGEVRADWPASFSFQVPEDAPSGVYLVKLSNGAADCYVSLVVREKTPAAPIVAILPFNTWQAYNLWGGTSLYASTRPDVTWHAHAVSFDRPFKGTGAFRIDEWNAFVAWAEGQNYDIGYATDQDLHADPSLLQAARLVVIVGHGEYWTLEMRQHMEEAIARGVSAAFLGANTAYWQVRYEETATGSMRRMIGYKEEATLDPFNAIDPTRVTTLFRSPPVNKPENAMMGIMYGSWVSTSAPLWTRNASHWLWTGAGVDDTTLIPGVYGDEVDQPFDNGFQPAGLEVVAETRVDEYLGHFNRGATSVYEAPSGAKVFASGSIDWNRALGRDGFADTRIRQLMANFISVAAGEGTLPAPVEWVDLGEGGPDPLFTGNAWTETVATGLSNPVAVASMPNGDAVVIDGNRIVRINASGHLTLIAGREEPGSSNDIGASAAFSSPRDLVVAPNGTIYVADTGNSRIRKINGNQVTTLAGGAWGFADGRGSNAEFSVPVSLALLPDGDLIVADTFNQRLRRVAPGGDVTTLVGNGQAEVVNGPSSDAQVSYPRALAAMPDGAVIMGEADTSLLRRISPGPNPVVENFAGASDRVGWKDGPLSVARISDTAAMAALPNGDLILVDGASARIRKLDANGVSTLVGGLNAGTADGSGGDAAFTRPEDVAVRPDGSLWVVDAAEGTLRRVTLQ